jgi:nitrogen fixation NifU-like protein
MYQERLLAEFRAPSNRHDMPDATARAERKNPLCGDAMCVLVREVDGQLADVSFTGHGCSLATASASLLTQAAWRRRRHDALALVRSVESMLKGEATPSPEFPELLAPLTGVVPFAGRHACVLLPWLALREALEQSGPPMAEPHELSTRVVPPR